MGRKIDDIRNWIEGAMQDSITPSISAVNETFGTVIMDDGREAQVQLILELDKEDWR